MIRWLICFITRIVWLGRCPMLAPGSDVRALAALFIKLFGRIPTGTIGEVGAGALPYDPKPKATRDKRRPKHTT
jgi:hypothetical protein